MVSVAKDNNACNPDDWRDTINCRKGGRLDKDGCGAVIEYTVQNLIMMYWQGIHARHHYVVVKCLQCGKLNRAGGIPDPVWKKFCTKEQMDNAIFDGFKAPDVVRSLSSY